MGGGAAAAAAAELQMDSPAADLVRSLAVRQHNPGDASFYEGFALFGLRAVALSPGSVDCSFSVPRCLTDADGNLTAGAIANLVDEVGSAAVVSAGGNIKVSVDMSISVLGAAKVGEELEVTARLLGQRGGYASAVVVLRKRSSGEVVAEGRHSLFGRLKNRL